MWEEGLRVQVERVGVGGARLRGLGLGAALRGSSARGGCGTPVGGREGRDS